MSLVLHADDLGMNRAVTDGIVRGFRQGMLTSTSLLSNAPDADRALAQWKELIAEQAAGRLPSGEVRRKLSDPESAFDLGVHLNLTQGRPLSGDRYPAELLDAEGRFRGVFSLFAKMRRSGDRFRNAIREEWRQQIQFLRDRGLSPTHLNGHQYVEMFPATAELVPELAEQFRIKSVRVAWEPAIVRTTVFYRFGVMKWPMAQVKRLFAARFRRLIDSHDIAHPDAFFGTAHAGRISLRLLQRFVKAARKQRLVEVALHPGEAASETTREDRADGWRDPLATTRSRELQMLVSAELPRFLESAGCRLGRLAPED
jgi:chitin disaccharide deacetylase